MHNQLQYICANDRTKKTFAHTSCHVRINNNNLIGAYIWLHGYMSNIGIMREKLQLVLVEAKIRRSVSMARLVDTV